MSKHERTLPIRKRILERILMWVRVDTMINFVVAIGTVLLTLKEFGILHPFGGE